MPKPSPGYSGTPLVNKLGIKPGMKLMILNAPEDYTGLLHTDQEMVFAGKNELPDFIHVFASAESFFLQAMKKILPMCRRNTKMIIWISWYKKSAGIFTDLDENKIRQFALSHQLVDIKVCAVTDEWSGLKLVVPVHLR